MFFESSKPVSWLAEGTVGNLVNFIGHCNFSRVLRLKADVESELDFNLN